MLPELKTVDELADWMRNRLDVARDVRQAWSRFVPELAYGRHLVPPPPSARCAAVMVLLYPRDRSWHVALIERPAGSEIHAGQVSFPGGAMEADETPEDTALRETMEEVGVPTSAVRLCGRLTPLYIYASDFLVTPCVAVAPQRPRYLPNPAEVAHVLEPTLEQLEDPRQLGRHEICRRGLVFQAPHIECEGRRIWGATSMMLAELFDVLHMR